jgi:hypothetical protein
MVDITRQYDYESIVETAQKRFCTFSKIFPHRFDPESKVVKDFQHFITLWKDKQYHTLPWNEKWLQSNIIDFPVLYTVSPIDCIINTIGYYCQCNSKKSHIVTFMYNDEYHTSDFLKYGTMLENKHIIDNLPYRLKETINGIELTYSMSINMYVIRLYVWYNANYSRIRQGNYGTMENSPLRAFYSLIGYMLQTKDYHVLIPYSPMFNECMEQIRIEYHVDYNSQKEQYVAPIECKYMQQDIIL